MSPTTKGVMRKKQTNWPFYTLVVIYAISTLILFSYFKSEEIKAEQMDAKTCIETHQTLNRSETQVICGKVVTL